MKRRKKVLLALGSYDYRIHQGIADYARQAGWQLLSTCERRGVIPPFWQGDGWIINHWRPEDLLKATGQGPLPTVSLTPWHFPAGVAVVTQDNLQIGRRAAEHLLERRFEHFATLLSDDLPVERQRIEGFIQTVEQAGFLCRLFRIEPQGAGRLTENPFHWIARQLLHSRQPVGIFCPCDFLASELIDACLYLRLAVPEQVAVVGAGNCELMDNHAAVPLSSVDGNQRAWGYAAAELLDRMMDGQPAPPQPLRIEPGPVAKRTSSDILAISHVGVARAVRFIWENFHQPIDVGDVVQAVGPITRRGLEKAFRRHLNRSPAQEILRKRLERAKKLILENHHKSYEVAKLCGFRDAEHLREVFHRKFGMAPRDFRKKFAQQAPPPTDPTPDPVVSLETAN